MTLLLRELGRFLLDAAAWIGSEVLLSAAAAAPAAAYFRRPLLRLTGAGLLGAAGFASLAVRFDAPLAWAPLVGRRPLPVAWSVAGALSAVALAALSARRRTEQP